LSTAHQQQGVVPGDDLLTGGTGEHRAIEAVLFLALVSLGAGLLLRITVCLWAAFLLLVASLFVKSLAVRIGAAWLHLSHLLGVVNTTVLLAIIYYAVLTPVALLYRFRHRDYLQMKRDRNRNSLWHAATPTSACNFRRLW
jgi:hypothetical protein